MGKDRVVKELQNRALLQAQRLRDREDTFNETASSGALGAKGSTPPEDGTSLHTLDVVVGRLDACHDHEGPQRRVHLEQTGAKPLGLRLAAAQPATENPQEFEH